MNHIVRPSVSNFSRHQCVTYLKSRSGHFKKEFCALGLRQNYFFVYLVTIWSQVEILTFDQWFYTVLIGPFLLYLKSLAKTKTFSAEALFGNFIHRWCFRAYMLGSQCYCSIRLTGSLTTCMAYNHYLKFHANMSNSNNVHAF